MKTLLSILLLSAGCLACSTPEDFACDSLCKELECPGDTVGVCDSGNQCACHGCLSFYDKYYGEDGTNAAPLCPSGPE